MLLTKKQAAEAKVLESILKAKNHKAGEAQLKSSFKSASTVFTGSKWDKRERKDLPNTKTKMGLGVLVDAFSEFNDPEAVAILEEKDRVEAAMAREMAERIDKARREDIRTRMDVQQVPSRLRKQLLVGAGPIARELMALRTKQGDHQGLVPATAVTAVLVQQLPGVLPKDMSRLAEVFTWPGTEIVDVATLVRKLLTPSAIGHRPAPRSPLQGGAGPPLFTLRVVPGTPSRAQSAGGVRGGSVRGASPPRPQSSPPRRSGNVLGLLGNEAGGLLRGKGVGEWNAADIVAKLSTSLRAQHTNTRSLFNALDADRDGQVSQVDFGRALALLGLGVQQGEPTNTSPHVSPHVSRLFRDFQSRPSSAAHVHRATTTTATTAAAAADSGADADADADALPPTVPEEEEEVAPLDLSTLLAALRRLRQQPPEDTAAAEQAWRTSQREQLGDQLGGLGVAPSGGIGGRRGAERRLSGSVTPSVTWGEYPSMPASPRGDRVGGGGGGSASDEEVCFPLASVPSTCQPPSLRPSARSPLLHSAPPPVRPSVHAPIRTSGTPPAHANRPDSGFRLQVQDLATRLTNKAHQLFSVVHNDVPAKAHGTACAPPPPPPRRRCRCCRHSQICRCGLPPLPKPPPPPHRFKHMDDNDSGLISYHEFAGMVLLAVPRNCPRKCSRQRGLRSTATTRDS